MRLEIIGLISFWIWYGKVLYGCGSWQMALVYLLVSHAATSPLHVQVMKFRSDDSLINQSKILTFHLARAVPLQYVNCGLRTDGKFSA